MSKPTIHDMEQAALWLDECDAGVAMEASCRIVAAWVRAEVLKREKDANIKAVALELGVAPSLVRAKLSARSKTR